MFEASVIPRTCSEGRRVRISGAASSGRPPYPEPAEAGQAVPGRYRDAASSITSSTSRRVLAPRSRAYHDLTSR